MSEAFQRIAMEAAPVFLSRGYDGVSLRALAKELGIQAASLYHHCPGGKRELYVRVLCTYLEDYRQRMEAARGRARFPAAVFRLADWMLDNPPVDAAAVLHGDLTEPERGQLLRSIHDAVLVPLTNIFDDGRTRERVRVDLDVAIAAAAVVSLVHGLGFAHLPPGRNTTSADLEAARSTVHAGLQLLLDGVTP